MPTRRKLHLKNLLAFIGAGAWSALKNLGWQEPRYFRFPAEGKEFELIELGSTGIHRAVVRGLNPEKTSWVDYNWPSHPFLVRHISGEFPQRTQT